MLRNTGLKAVDALPPVKRFLLHRTMGMKGHQSRLSLGVLTLMKSLKQLFGSRHPLLTRARSLGFNTVNHLAPLKHHLAGVAMGTSGELPEICRPR